MRRWFLALFCLVFGAACFAVIAWASTSTWSSCGANITKSNGNLTASKASGFSAWGSCIASPTSYTTGKHYFEVSEDSADSSTGWMAGVGLSTSTTANFTGSNTSGVSFQDVGGHANAWFNNAFTSGLTFCAKGTGTHIGFAIDVGNKIWCTNDGTHWNTGGTDSPVTPSGGFDVSGVVGAVFPTTSLFGGTGSADTATLFTTSAGFAFSVPSGFTAWDSGSGGSTTISSMMLMGVGN